MTVSEESHAPSGGAENPSGIESKVENQSGKEDDFVKRETYQKTLAQEKNLRVRLKEAEDAVLKFKQDSEARAEKTLEEQNEYKKLYETHKAKSETLENQMNDYQSSLIDGHKIQAVLDSLPGKVKKREYYQFIDTSEIAFDPESKVIDEESVKTAVNRFVESYPDLIESREKRRLPNDSPQSSAPKTLNQMSLAEQLAAFGKLHSKA